MEAISQRNELINHFRNKAPLWISLCLYGQILHNGL